MRITMMSLNRHVQKVIHDRYGDMAKLQEQLSTGKRLLRPSDDPIGITNDLKLRSKVEQTNQYKDNLEDGLAFMNVTDTSMMSMNTIMQRVRELTIQAANDTNSATERRFIQKEVEQLTRQMVALSNTNFKGDYIFGGTQVKIEPYPIDTSRGSTPENYTRRQMAYFNGAGGVGTPYQLRDAFTDTPASRIIPGSLTIAQGNTRYIDGTDFTVDYVNGTITPLNAALAVDMSDGGTFAGPNYSMNGFQIRFEYIDQGRDIYGDPVSTAGEIQREIEPDINMTINIAGDELLNDRDSGVYLLNELIQINQNLLYNNGAGIEASVTRLDLAFKNLLSAEAKNGARVNRFDATVDRNEQQSAETTRLQSEIEDAELAKTVMDFSLMESIYNAALKSAARVIQPSLVDFL